MSKEYIVSEHRVNKMIDQVGDLDSMEREVEEDFNVAVIDLKDKARKTIKDLRAKKFKLMAAIYAFYLKNQKELTQDGKRKIVSFVSGDFGCFFPSKKEVIIRGSKEKVIKTLRRLKLGRFVKETKKERIDKDAIAKNEELFSGIEGIAFKEEERFKVVPTKTKRAITEAIKKLKKFLA